MVVTCMEHVIKMVDVSLCLTAVCAVDVHSRVVILVLPADDFSAIFFPPPVSCCDTYDGVTCRHFLAVQNRYMMPLAVFVRNAVCCLPLQWPTKRG
jgi:hypothetical protein